MEPKAVARMLAVGGTFQELTAATPLVGANQVFRIWRKGETFVLKVYGSDARERREFHALDALQPLKHIPKILDRGVQDVNHWILFADAGQWTLQTLPENPGFARRAGAILKSVHETDSGRLSNLARGIDAEWIAVDFQSTLKRLERYRSRVGVSVDQIKAARAVNPPYASAPVIAHTDPTLRNFIVDDGGDITLIDWEWATLAPPEWDLTRAMWSAAVNTGPLAAAAIVDGYGSTVDSVQLDRWIVYHSAQTMVRFAERQMSARPTDLPDNLVPEFNRAVLGATSAEIP